MKTEHDYNTIADSLDDQIVEVYEALGFFLNAEFNKAYSKIQEKAELGYPYHNLGLSFLFLIKALFTFDPDDIQKTIKQIDGSIAIATQIKDSQKQSLYTKVSSYVRPQQTEMVVSDALTSLISHCELIVSELVLLRAVLLISSDSQEGWILILRQSLHIHASYSYYIRAINSPMMEDSNFRSGVLLGNGVFNLMFPLLPPKIASLFSYFGYKGNTLLGVKQLVESTTLKNSIRSPLSELVILIYHLVVACTLPTAERARDEVAESKAEWFLLCDSLLGKNLKLYPQSPIYKYFMGRFLFLQRRLYESIEMFEETMKMEIEWPQLKHAGYWEVCLCSLYTLDWERGYKYSREMSRENKWSKAFYRYLEATFLWSMDESRIDEVKELLKEIPFLMKRVAGRTLPIEKFALHRATMVLNENRMPFHPALEIALVWNGFPLISQNDREKIEGMMTEAISVTEDPEKKCQILLTLATLKRLRSSFDASIEYAKSALKLRVPTDSYCIPLAHLELSQVYLAMGDVQSAEHYYCESVGYKYQYLVKKFLEIRQSRVKIEIGIAKGN